MKKCGRIVSTVGQAIEKAGMTRAEVCKTLGIGPANLESYCSAASAPSFERLAQLCALLNCGVGDLFVYDDEPTEAEREFYDKVDEFYSYAADDPDRPYGCGDLEKEEGVKLK